MAYVIAVSGKGGTGKSTLASLLVRILKEESRGSVLAVDADPNNNLAEFLGIHIENSIGSILDEVAANPNIIPAGISKDRFIEYKVQESIAEADGFDVLTMGRPEGPGCYCYVNNVLRNTISRLINEYDYIVIDNEAGLEHLSRRTTRSCDCLLIVSDATPAGLRAARRISELAAELKFKAEKKFLMINRLNSTAEIKDFPGFQLIGSLPEDEEVLAISRNGSSLMKLSSDAKFFKKLKEIIPKICPSK